MFFYDFALHALFFYLASLVISQNSALFHKSIPLMHVDTRVGQ